ncbi:MAG: DNA-protecting protein DprA, partial [Desulfovibrionaceae bacterium]|nr:DNA-protecting protein DprA [Desulfovibrionaceae bacterium]
MDLPQAPLSDLALEAGLDHARLEALLRRGGSLGFALEKWQRNGLWAVSRGDERYPSRVKAHLKEQSPPFFFGSGDPSLLEREGLAIVGSRNVDERGVAFAGDAARLCAENLMPVVSGCARGVDSIAMAEAVRHGGTAVGFVAESLLKKSVSPDFRRGIAEGLVLLLSPYFPESSFSVGAAMGRNKLIYAQAAFALVVCSDTKGGTWSGATEELRRENRRPVFIRAEAGCPPGNTGLLELGGIPWPETPSGVDLRTLLAERARGALDQPVGMAGQRSLLEISGLAEQEGKPCAPDERTVLAGAQEVHEAGQQAEAKMQAVSDQEPCPESVSPAEAEPPAQVLYRAARSCILALLEEPLALEDIAGRLDIEKKQMKAWLDRAAEEKLIEKTRRPVRYKKSIQGRLC